jgi:hypothetical protein
VTLPEWNAFLANSAAGAEWAQWAATGEKMRCGKSIEPAMYLKTVLYYVLAAKNQYLCSLLSNLVVMVEQPFECALPVELMTGSVDINWAFGNLRARHGACSLANH